MERGVGINGTHGDQAGKTDTALCKLLAQGEIKRAALKTALLH